MPFIKTYESQVAPAGVIAGEKAPTTGNDGGFGTLAEGLQHATSNIYHRQLEKDDAETVVGIAQLKAELAERRQAATVSGDAANPDWFDNEREYAQERLGTVSGSMRTADGRRAAQIRTEQFLSEETPRWLSTQATVAAQLQKNQLQSVEDLTLRAVQADPTTHGEATAAFLSDIDGPAYVKMSRDVKEDYARQFKYKSARAMLDGTEKQYGSEAALFALDGVRDQMPAEQYTSLRDHFTNRARQEVAKDKEQEQYKLYQRVSELTKAGGNPIGLIDSGVENKLLTAEQGIGLREKYDKYVEHQQKVSAANTAFHVGDFVSFDAIEPKVKKDAADAWLAEQTARYVATDADGKKAVASEIVRKGVEMDYVFDGLKNSLRASPHGEGFGAAVDLYRSLETFDPYYANKYVSDDQRARFEVYSAAAKGGATHEQALSFAQNITHENIVKARKLIREGEGKTYADDIRGQLNDGPWLKGMLNSRQAADAVIDRVVTQVAGNPSIDTATAVKSAIKMYESKNAQIGQMWMPRSFLSGVPADKMTDVADHLITRLPEVLRQNKLPVSDGKYALAPDYKSDRDGRLQVYDPAGFPVPGLRFGPEDFKAEYRTLQANAYEKAKKKVEDRRKTTFGYSSGLPR